MKSKTVSSPEPVQAGGPSTTPADAADPPVREDISRDALRADLAFGPVRVRFAVDHTPGGLVALGGCVTSILLGAAAIVWVSTAAPRRHPLATALALRRR